MTAIQMATVTATMPTLMPSALPLEHFLLRRLLLLSRLLIYSSSCCTFRRLLLSRRPPNSMTALPPLSLLWCHDASHRETLMLTLVSDVSFWWRWREETGQERGVNTTISQKRDVQQRCQQQRQRNRQQQASATKGQEGGAKMMLQCKGMCAARWYNEEPS